MIDTKSELIKETISKFETLPDNKQEYILGIMQGMLIASADKQAG